jgi:hypothetical protein
LILPLGATAVQLAEVTLPVHLNNVATNASPIDRYLRQSRNRPTGQPQYMDVKLAEAREAILGTMTCTVLGLAVERLWTARRSFDATISGFG